MTTQAIYSMAEVAKVLGWRTERTRDWLVRINAAFQVGHRWYTTPDRLRSEFPELLDALQRRHAGESWGEE